MFKGFMTVYQRITQGASTNWNIFCTPKPCPKVPNIGLSHVHHCPRNPGKGAMDKSYFVIFVNNCVNSLFFLEGRVD